MTEKEGAGSYDLKAHSRLRWFPWKLDHEDMAILLSHDSGKDERVACPADGVRDEHDRYGCPRNQTA